MATRHQVVAVGQLGSSVRGRTERATSRLAPPRVSPTMAAVRRSNGSASVTASRKPSAYGTCPPCWVVMSSTGLGRRARAVRGIRSGFDGVVGVMADPRKQPLAEHDVVR